MIPMAGGSHRDRAVAVYLVNGESIGHAQYELRGVACMMPSYAQGVRQSVARQCQADLGRLLTAELPVELVKTDIHGNETWECSAFVFTRESLTRLLENAARMGRELR